MKISESLLSYAERFERAEIEPEKHLEELSDLYREIWQFLDKDVYSVLNEMGCEEEDLGQVEGVERESVVVPIPGEQTDVEALATGRIRDISGKNLKILDKRVDRITMNLLTAYYEAAERDSVKTATEKENFTSSLLEQTCKGEWHVANEPGDGKQPLVWTDTMVGEIWARLNERGNYTLMFPEDY